MVKLVVEVSGGVVQAVYSTHHDVEVRVVDHDNIKDGGGDPELAAEDLEALAVAEKDWVPLW